MSKFIMLLILFMGSFVYAQETELKFRHLSINQGLSQNLITSIFQDYKGYMWFGTRDGLNRFDGYSFKIYKANTFDSGSITDNYITSIFEDENNNLWIGTMHGGLHLYDRNQDTFISINMNSFPANARFVSMITGSKGDELLISFLSGHVVSLKIPQNLTQTNSKTVFESKILFNQNEDDLQLPACIFLNSDGTLWINGTKGVTVIDRRSSKKLDVLQNYPTFVVSYSGEIPKKRERNDLFSPLTNDIQEIKSDHSGNLWMTSSHGLYQFNSKKKEFVLYKFSRSALSVLAVTNGVGEKEIWISTHHNGLVNFNPNDHTIKFRPNGTFGGDEFSDMTLTTIVSSRDGNIWLGSNGRGIFSYSPTFSLFRNGELFKNEKSKKVSKSIYALHKSTKVKDHVLYSTLNDFVHIDLRSENYTSYADTLIKSHAFAEDKTGDVWLANEFGLFRYNAIQKTAELMVEDVKEMPISVYIDARGCVWYTTYLSLCSFDPKTRESKRFPFFTKNYDRMETILFSMIHADVDGFLWIGTTNGLYHFDIQKGVFSKIYKNDPTDRFSLSSNEVKSILNDPFDPKRYIWIGTTIGLNRMDKLSGKFEHFTIDNGLPNNTIYGILPDEEGNLWLSTNSGLSAFNIQDRTCMNFDVSNGLQSNEFNSGAAFKSADGELFFGGINGYNRFYPRDIITSQKKLPIVASSIQLIGTQKGGDYLFEDGEINELTYDQNNIKITLSVLDYASIDKIKYAYRIVNQDSLWVEMGSNREVALTNLSPGLYVFQGRGTDGFGRWNDQVVEIVFKISPPWWNSVMAKILYLGLVIGIMYLLRKRYRKQLQLEQAIEIERRQAMAILEIDKVKSRFLANITHEFRTPLTLIKGHVERMQMSGKMPDFKMQYVEIERNTNQLLRLITQLVDLTKLESGEYKVRYAKGDILADLKVTVYSFLSYAEQKNIQLSLLIDQGSEAFLKDNHVIYDVSILVTVLNNLLSNACKFTGEGGKIAVEFSFFKERNEFFLQVSDTGTGIPESELPKIFDRFYQIDSSTVRSYEGSGVGLSLVKELVTLHGGSISVESKMGEGSIFKVRMLEGVSEDARVDIEDSTLFKLVEIEKNESLPTSEKPLILVIEDNSELRSFIRDSLGTEYDFCEAVDGQEGLEIATKQVPDLIISDVMMPKMDGYMLCNLLKQQEVTSHIPIIMLTARATQEDKILGLKQGADDYLLKPFSVAELQLRVNNSIQSRRLLYEKFQDRSVKPSLSPETISKETVFVNRLVAIIENRLSDSHFSVEELAQSACLSNSQLQRKLKAITGGSPITLITEVRMQYALRMLKANQDNIGEIAYQVGFESPGYFTKVFKKHFGFLPSEKGKIHSASNI